MKPPVAKKIPASRQFHQTRLLQDDYAWLRQDNWKEMFDDTSLLDADIRSYIEAENAYTKDSFFAPHQQLIDQLMLEMKQRMEIHYDTAPVQDGAYEYFARYSEADYPVYLRRDSNGIEEVILDVTAELAGDGKKVFLGDVDHSPDHNLLAILVDYSGAENYDILIKDLRTGKFLDDRLVKCGTIEWAPDSTSFYYTYLSDDEDEYRFDRVFHHRLGDAQDKDNLLFQDDRAEYFLGLYKTGSHRFLVIRLRNHGTSEIHVMDLSDPQARLVRVLSAEENIQCEIDHSGDLFYLLNNADGAEDFKIMTAPVATPQKQYWTEYRAAKQGCYIKSIEAFSDHLVTLEFENALPQITVTKISTGESRRLSFDDPAYQLAMGDAAGFDRPLLRIMYSSPRTPTQFMNYNLDTGERIILRQENIADHKPENYIVERVFIPSHDGVMVPLTITRHKNTPLDGTAPLRLYAYGAYGHTLPSSFGRMNFRYTMLNRGFISVDAHVRGGSDMGRQWYQDGKLLHKKNTFIDFISAAEWLVENKYTSRGKIGIEGASAGGMLVGAALNMASPGLFGCAVAGVPFVDVMSTMMDETLPLTKPEWQEWGNPVADATAFDYMLSYSPYDNTVAREYPPIYIDAGLTDPRVTYWEPAKWAAKLRAVKTDSNPLYLYIHMDSGHMGDPGRFSSLEETARNFAFMITTLSGESSL